MIEMLKNGSGIHIKKKNRGKFTSYCGGKVTDECIRRAKSSGNPTLVKRATFAANARHFKHLTGGTINLTPVNLKTFYDNYKLYGNNRFIDTLLLRNVDNLLIHHNVGLPQRLAIIYTTLLEGNRTGSHGNGATGLVGWRGGRASGLPSSVKGQADKIYDETYGEFNGNNWNHGGTGSGYNSARDAQKAFKNAKDVKSATQAFNYGYVRPPKEDSLYRTRTVSRLFGYRKGGKAFVPGHDIADSNPKAYKYVKKHYKMKGLLGGNLPDLSAYIQQSSIYAPFVIYGQTGNDYLEWKQKQDEIKLLRELLKQSDDFQRWSGIGEQLLNLGIGYLSNKGSNTSSVSTPTYFNTPKLQTSLQTSFKPNYDNLLSVPSLTPPNNLINK